MNQAEHTKLVESEKRRGVIVGVDRIAARRFFTEASISDVAAKTGYAPYFEKSVVYMFILLGPLALLGAVAGSFWHFGWWEIIAAIVFPILYLYYSRLSRLGGARAYMVSLALASVLAFHFANLLAFPTLTQILYFLPLRFGVKGCFTWRLQFSIATWHYMMPSCMSSWRMALC
jgi:hypothetical protein